SKLHAKLVPIAAILRHLLPVMRGNAVTRQFEGRTLLLTDRCERGVDFPRGNAHRDLGKIGMVEEEREFGQRLVTACADRSKDLRRLGVDFACTLALAIQEGREVRFEFRCAGVQPQYHGLHTYSGCTGLCSVSHALPRSVRRASMHST